MNKITWVDNMVFAVLLDMLLWGICVQGYFIEWILRENLFRIGLLLVGLHTFFILILFGYSKFMARTI